jgi:plastocyanin
MYEFGRSYLCDSSTGRTKHMSACRIIATIFLSSLLLACGSSSPSNPSPTPSSVPSPVASPVPSPVPSPTPSSNAGAGVSILRGASLLTTTAFAPNPIAVPVGGTVTWMNNDNVAHTSTADGGAWNSGSIAPGASFSRTFASAGTFQYHCAIHPGMVGTVNVQ